MHGASSSCLTATPPLMTSRGLTPCRAACSTSQPWHHTPALSRPKQQQQQRQLRQPPAALPRPVCPCSSIGREGLGAVQQWLPQRQTVPSQAGRLRQQPAAASSDASGGPINSLAIPDSLSAATEEPTYSLENTRILVETAMLSAVTGLAFLLATLLKMEQSLGYFLPLPIVIAGMRSGPGAAWNTMLSTACLLLVLLGPLRAVNYCLMHGALAAALGSCWRLQWHWAISVPLGAALRMGGQLGYLLLSSFTLNENLFVVVVANVHGLLDRLSAALGTSGAPSTLTVQCMIFALLLVNALCYCFLVHVIYHIVLSVMGFKMGPLPGIVRKYLYAGLPQQQEQGGAGTAAAAAPPVKG